MPGPGSDRVCDSDSGSDSPGFEAQAQPPQYSESMTSLGITGRGGLGDPFRRPGQPGTVTESLHGHLL